MAKARPKTLRILLACLVVPMMLCVACSGSDTSENSGWVGTTPLDEALDNGKPTVAEFGSATCIPCKRMKPILEEIVAEYGDKVNLAFTDVRIHTSVAAKYKIVYMPTQVFFNGAGQEVSRHVGFWPKEDVVAHLQGLGLL